MISLIAASERYQRMTASEGKCPVFLLYVEDCVAVSRNISMFFNERAAVSWKYLTTASERKKCAS